MVPGSTLYASKLLNVKPDTMRALVLLALLAGCGRSSEPEAGPVCPQDPSFNRAGLVQVMSDSPPAELRRDLDLSALARESAGTAGSGRLQGLTEVEHELKERTLVSLKPSRGRACVWLETIVIDMRPASVKIFVPKEYPEGSCEYMAVLSHEREHERVHRERLEAAGLEVKAALEGARWLPAKGNPMETADQDSAKAALDDKLRRVVHPMYEKFKADLNAAQMALDSPELYRLVTDRCQGWK
jgi:hypothetical protein